MDISSLHKAYANGALTPAAVVKSIYDRIDSEGQAPIWITLVPREQALQRVSEVGSATRASLPLFGIPFAVKDNIDVAGLRTTAACPAYAYTPTQSAPVVLQLEAAGAILIGKTNMDQFATGLVGTRTPYGICSCVFDKRFISGGSSSGSALAVAAGWVSFALGTDTAGSGRVPAMFNNLVGLKPTHGLLSTRGVVPACRTLDCVSIFTETVPDAALVLNAATGFDAEDAYARERPIGAGAAPWVGASTFRFGVLTADTLEFHGDPHNAAMYQQAIAKLVELGGEPVVFDFAPLVAVGQLLYRGPWAAERYAAVGAFLDAHPDSMDPTVAKIILGGVQYSASDAFKAAYKLEDLRRQTEPTWKSVDVICLPTAPRTYTIDEISESPIERNSDLGRYTNFVNLLDLSAVAIPAGFRPDGLPFGVSLIGKTFSDHSLLALGDRLHRAFASTLGGSSRKVDETDALPASTPPPGCCFVAVVGAHLTGQPLNRQLTSRGGRLISTRRTHTDYRLYALEGTVPPKPGLLRVPGCVGGGIEVEVWALPEETIGGFLEAIPSPLCIGTLQLEDGFEVKGFLVEPAAVDGAADITHLGGWRNYLRTLGQDSRK